MNLDVKLMLSATGIEQPILSDIDAYITYNQYCALWQEITHRSAQSDVGLRLADFAHVGTFDLLGYVMQSSSNQGEAWTRMIRYSQLLNQGAEFTFATQGQVAQLIYDFPTVHLPPPPPISEWIIANILQMSRAMTGLNWIPKSVGFRHPTPIDLTAYQQKFCCPLDFNQPFNYIQMDVALLQVPMLKAEPGLCAVLEHYGEDLLKRFPPMSNFLDDVRRAINEGLQKGNVRSEATSKRLNVAPRTLQRKLKEAGTSYREVLDEMRRDASLYYLQNTDLAICEVAFLLGFSETSAFNHAFKRWYSSSPKEFRRLRSIGTIA